MIKEKFINVKVTNLTIERYLKLGYNCNIGDTIKIDIEHCPNNNDIKLTYVCDECNIAEKETNGTSFVNSKGKWICNDCKTKIKENTKCEYCGCGNATFRKLSNMTLCLKHYNNWKDNNGTIKQTLFDENTFTIYDDYAEFDTYDLHGNKIKTYKIDLEDVDFVKSHKCHTHKVTGYAIFKDENKKNIALHKYLTNTQYHPELIVDHINRDKTDNRKSNLRVTTSVENNLNTGLHKHNTSGVKGVSYDKKNNRYEAYVNKYNHKIGLGTYKTLEEAVVARKIGEYVVYNNKLLYIENLKNELKDIDIYSHIAYSLAVNKQKELDEKYGK